MERKIDKDYIMDILHSLQIILMKMFWMINSFALKVVKKDNIK